MKNWKRAINEWWNGDAEYNGRRRSGEFDDDDAHPIAYEKFTLSAKIVRGVFEYWCDHHWKIITTILIALGLWVQWYIYTHPNHPPTISYGNEGSRTFRK